jgi:toxin ParE1/3/4
VNAKRIVRRARADRDIEEATHYYYREGGAEVALGFLAALEEAYEHIAAHPASGSPRLGHRLGIQELRSWPVKRYPYLIFFVERDDYVDVWRILRGARDVPTHLREPID